MGKRDLPDIYNFTLGPAALRLRCIYQANPSCPCYNLYIHTYIIYNIYIYIYTTRLNKTDQIVTFCILRNTNLKYSSHYGLFLLESSYIKFTP